MVFARIYSRRDPLFGKQETRKGVRGLHKEAGKKGSPCRACPVHRDGRQAGRPERTAALVGVGSGQRWLTCTSTAPSLQLWVVPRPSARKVPKTADDLWSSGQTGLMVDGDASKARIEERRRIVSSELRVAFKESETLADDWDIRSVLFHVAVVAVYGPELTMASYAAGLRHRHDRGAQFCSDFISTLMARLAPYPLPPDTPSRPPAGFLDSFYEGVVEGGAASDAEVQASRSVSSFKLRLRDSDSAIESADQALSRQARAEIVNEILAGGAVAASVTAAASVAKAKIEATTQRRKIDLDAETQRLKIASDERIAGFQALRAQAPQGEPAESDD